MGLVTAMAVAGTALSAGQAISSAKSAKETKSNIAAEGVINRQANNAALATATAQNKIANETRAAQEEIAAQQKALSEQDFAAQQESVSIQNAQNSIAERAAQRTAAREERLRRGSLTSVAEATGTVGSSGVQGAASAIGSNFTSLLARQAENAGITAALSDTAQTSATAIFNINQLTQESNTLASQAGAEIDDLAYQNTITQTNFANQRGDLQVQEAANQASYQSRLAAINTLQSTAGLVQTLAE